MDDLRTLETLLLAGPLMLIALLLIALSQLKAIRYWWGSLAAQMDRPARTLGLVALGPGVAALLWLLTRGFPPVAAFLVGAFGAFGIFSILLAAFHKERIMLEGEVGTHLRLTTGAPLRSTTLSRALAVGVGVVALGLSGALLYLVAVGS